MSCVMASTSCGSVLDFVLPAPSWPASPQPHAITSREPAHRARAHACANRGRAPSMHVGTAWQSKNRDKMPFAQLLLGVRPPCCHPCRSQHIAAPTEERVNLTAGKAECHAAQRNISVTNTLLVLLVVLPIVLLGGGARLPRSHVRAKVWPNPAATVRHATPPSAATCTGCSWSCALPTPHCPYAPQPHAQTLPSAHAAALWRPPAATCWAAQRRGPGACVSAGTRLR